ncbi:hypothetical protein, partial [Gordonia araii]|uniref:hypothetical protein n=1 Tax=Gordonia araii TaxID=263909 RepID=UPI001B8CEB9D
LNSANAAGRIAADPGNPNYDPRWFTNGKLDLGSMYGELDFPPDATPEQKQAMRDEQGSIRETWERFIGTPQENFEAGRTDSGGRPDRSTPSNPGG